MQMLLLHKGNGSRHTFIYIPHLHVHIKHIKVYEGASYIHKNVQPITQGNIHHVYVYVCMRKKVRIKEAIHTLTGINQNLYLSKDS